MFEDQHAENCERASIDLNHACELANQFGTGPGELLAFCKAHGITVIGQRTIMHNMTGELVDLYGEKEISVNNDMSYIETAFECLQNFHVMPPHVTLREHCGDKPYPYCIIHWIDDGVTSRLYRQHAATMVRRKILTDGVVVHAIRKAVNLS